MPHRVVARLFVRTQLRIERAIARVSPPAAAWLHRHYPWLYRPIHVIAMLAMLWWGSQMWFLLPHSAFASPNYRVLRYFNLEVEGALLMLIGIVLFISPRWWLTHRFGRSWPLVPSFALITAGSVIVGVAGTITYTSLVSGAAALGGVAVIAGVWMVIEGIRDACLIARLSVETANRERCRGEAINGAVA